MREKLLLPLISECAADATTHLALHADLSFYVGVKVHGFQPFVSHGALVVALGEPICRPDARERLLREFLDNVDRSKRTAGAFPVSAAQLDDLGRFGFSGVAAAVEPFCRPDEFRLDGPRARRLRPSVKKAEAGGVRCAIRFGVELPARESEQLQSLYSEWRDRVHSAGARLLLSPSPFVARSFKRYAIASVDREVCAFATLVPLAARNGWAVEGLFRAEDAPVGASECLLVRVLEELRDEGFTSLTLGPTVLAAPPVSDEHCDSSDPRLVANSVFRWLYSHAPELLKYRSAHGFKQKFHPQTTEVRYFAYRGASLTADLLLDFLSIIFQGFEFKGLVHELWERFLSEPMARTLLPESEEV